MWRARLISIVKVRRTDRFRSARIGIQRAESKKSQRCARGSGGLRWDSRRRAHSDNRRFSVVKIYVYAIFIGPSVVASYSRHRYHSCCAGRYTCCCRCSGSPPPLLSSLFLRSSLPFLHHSFSACYCVPRGPTAIRHWLEIRACHAIVVSSFLPAFISFISFVPL